MASKQVFVSSNPTQGAVFLSFILSCGVFFPFFSTCGKLISVQFFYYLDESLLKKKFMEN